MQVVWLSFSHKLCNVNFLLTRYVCFINILQHDASGEEADSDVSCAYGGISSYLCSGTLSCTFSADLRKMLSINISWTVSSLFFVSSLDHGHLPKAFRNINTGHKVF